MQIPRVGTERVIAKTRQSSRQELSLVEEVDYYFERREPWTDSQ
jgi:hypothetical protein